ncbi:helix-turn-helix transcriptional regulator [Imperialibacter sp.]|uniref:helix-turn-helix domain-containing protein n=1 Tax=Imperialibacter sp. TaxID=2038411 RepID=UPI0032EAB66D
MQKKIGILIGRFRKQNGWSQEDLAELTGFHPDYIGKIERGERAPSLKTLLKIIDKLKVRYSVFFKELQEN